MTNIDDSGTNSLRIDRINTTSNKHTVPQLQRSNVIGGDFLLIKYVIYLVFSVVVSVRITGSSRVVIIKQIEVVYISFDLISNLATTAALLLIGNNNRVIDIIVELDLVYVDRSVVVVIVFGEMIMMTMMNDVEFELITTSSHHLTMIIRG